LKFKKLRYSNSFLFSPERKINQSVVSLATIRRTIGATTSTAGKAHTHAITKACIHLKKKPPTGPKFTNVKMPDMMNAISMDIKNAKRSEVKRGEISILYGQKKEKVRDFYYRMAFKDMNVFCCISFFAALIAA
jgi:hypothetical protein